MRVRQSEEQARTASKKQTGSTPSVSCRSSSFGRKAWLITTPNSSLPPSHPPSLPPSLLTGGLGAHHPLHRHDLAGVRLLVLVRVEGDIGLVVVRVRLQEVLGAAGTGHRDGLAGHRLQGGEGSERRVVRLRLPEPGVKVGGGGLGGLLGGGLEGLELVAAQGLADVVGDEGGSLWGGREGERGRASVRVGEGLIGERMNGSSGSFIVPWADAVKV